MFSSLSWRLSAVEFKFRLAHPTVMLLCGLVSNSSCDPRASPATTGDEAPSSAPPSEDGLRLELCDPDWICVALPIGLRGLSASCLQKSSTASAAPGASRMEPGRAAGFVEGAEEEAPVASSFTLVFWRPPPAATAAG